MPTHSDDVDALLVQADWIVGLARRVACSEHDADNLVQDTWIAALQRPTTIRGNLRGWLATVLRNKARQDHRATARRDAREHAAARPEAQPSTAELVGRAARQRDVVSHVLALDPLLRTVVLRRFFDDLSPPEIAECEGIPLKTVHSRLERALEKLRSRLDSEHGGREGWLGALVLGIPPDLSRPATATIAVGIPQLALLMSSPLKLAVLAAVALILGAVIWRTTDSALPFEPSESAGSVAARVASSFEGSPLTEVDRAEATHRIAAVTESKVAAASEGRFHGELRILVLGQERQLVEAAVVTLAPRVTVAVETDEELGTESLNFVRYRITTGDDGQEITAPSALAGDKFVAEDGRWAMPIPTQDLVVVRVVIGTEELRPVRGRSITQGAKSAIVVLRRIEPGLLTVELEGVGGFTDDLEVRSTPCIPTGVTIEFEISGRLSVGDEPKHPTHRAAPVAPSNSTLIASSATSPVPIPVCEYPREIWVGRPGCQWERVEWAVDTQAAMVRLRSVGSLEIELIGCVPRGNRYELRLIRNSSIICLWKRLREDALLFAGDLGAGDYRLLLRQQSRVGQKTIIDRIVTIEAGTIGDVSLDVSEYVGEPTGDLVVEVLLPPEDVFASRSLGLAVGSGARSSEEGARALMAADRVHLGAPAEGDRVRVIEMDGLPAGDYLIGIFPCGFLTTVTIMKGETAHQLVDLRDLATVTVTSKDATPRTTLRWFSDAGGPECWLGPPGHAVEGTWRFVCLAGSVSVATHDPKGTQLGERVRLEVSAGFNELELD